MVLKYVDEYRDGELARGLIAAIRAISTEKIRLMEVCGTHTMSIFRHGIRSVLPETIELLSGPGCPVCVTAQQDIDAFVEIAMQENLILTTFGDLIRVPGTLSSLQNEKGAGRDIRIVYSIFDALEIAAADPEREVVFCGIGFETTTPTVAAAILMATERGIDNFSIHSAHKLTPPALAALMDTPDVEIDGFILPGHVSVITGTDGYREVFEKYRVPSAIAGFEPVDILKAILMLLKQKISGVAALENGYERAVSKEGNLKAIEIMTKVFEPADSVWRGIGEIAKSGMKLRENYNRFNALEKFGIVLKSSPEPAGCSCGKILMGLKTPEECVMYGKRCTPAHPVGPCMVSSEGACAAYYRYRG